MKKINEKILRTIRKIVGTKALKSNQQIIISQQSKLIDIQNEILKSQIFNNTITDSEWLKYKSFSPGGWAVDYGFLYTLYRVLNDMKPKNILEFGLGQSSKMIHQYVDYYEGTKAVTCEHDQDWIKYFNRHKNETYDINIKLVETEEINYNDKSTLSYKNIETLFGDEKFDLILVDAPFGSEHYSRSQILKLISNNLSPSFCVIVDDVDRQGEIETIEELKNKFDSINVKYLDVYYKASKKHYLVCDVSNKFLTSL